MTTPFARTRALLQTKQFLHRLVSLGDDAIPLSMRAEAEALLRHYPTLLDIEAAHKSNPEIFGPVPPFSRMSGGVSVESVVAATREQNWDSFFKDGPATSEDFEK